MKRYFFILILVLSTYCKADGQKLEAIDSVFMNSLSDFSKNLESIKNSIWPDMKIGPYCIFRLNGPAFLINHPAPPQDARLLNYGIYVLNQSEYGLFGATQTMINGTLTAHNDYGQQFYSSINQFYAELFHELHHVYQRNFVKDLKFDNPADLLTYPEDARNFAIKQFENILLLEMVSGPPEKFQKNLDLFYSCRTRREEIIGTKYIDYEKGAESIEGPATFCEYSYLQHFSKDIADQEYINHRYLYSLEEPLYSRNSLRGRCLLTGMAQCIILSKHYKNWQSEYYSSGLFLYDYFIKKMSPHVTALPEMHYERAKADIFTTLEKQKHMINYEAFMKQPGIRVILKFKEFPEFQGFDPMHAEAINDSTILHSTLLKLAKGDNSLNIVNYKTVSVIADQIWFVKSIEIFVPEESISFHDNKLIISDNSAVEIKWKYIDKIRKGNEYTLILE
jgi:hypothetical protein